MKVLREGGGGGEEDQSTGQNPHLPGWLGRLGRGQVLQVQLFNSQVLRVQLFNSQVLQVQLFNYQVLQVQLFNSQVLQVQLFNFQGFNCFQSTLLSGIPADLSWKVNNGKIN